MATTTMLPFQLLADVPKFDGKPEELEMFIKNIEGVRQLVEATFIELFDLRIRNKIVGAANISLINSNNPTRWEEVKVVLRINFIISDSVENLINKIKTAEFRTTVNQFYEYMESLKTKLNLKTSIDNEQWFSCTNNERMVLKIFINKLPNEPKLILKSRNPYSLLNAKEILIDTDYFYIGKSQTSQFFQSPSSNIGNGQSGNFASGKRYRNNFRYSAQNNDQCNSGNFGRNNFVNNEGNCLNNIANFENHSFRGRNLNTDRNLKSGNFNQSFNNSGNFNRGGNNGNVNNRSGNMSNRNRYTANNGQVQEGIPNAVPMDIDSVEVSNFHSQAEKIYPA